MIKTCLTIRDKFFISGLIHYLQSCIKGCHICQLSRNDKLPTGQLQTRIHLIYMLFCRLSMDLRVMHRLYKGHKFIFCIIDEVTNYLITVPIHQSRSEEIGDTLIKCYLKILCAWLYNNGPRQHIYILTYKLLVQETCYKYKIIDTLQLSIVTGRTQNKIIIYNLDQTLNRSRSDVVKFAITNLVYDIFNTSNLANYSPVNLSSARNLSYFRLRN